jgi:hypothetical protein
MTFCRQKVVASKTKTTAPVIVFSRIRRNLLIWTAGQAARRFGEAKLLHRESLPL